MYVRRFHFYMQNKGKRGIFHPGLVNLPPQMLFLFLFFYVNLGNSQDGNK